MKAIPGQWKLNGDSPNFHVLIPWWEWRQQRDPPLYITQFPASYSAQWWNIAAGAERPSFLGLTGERTCESCKCDDICNDRLFSRLVVCNWSQEFSTRSDTPSLHCGFPEAGSCIATRLGGPSLNQPSLTSSKASEMNSKFPNQAIILSLSPLPFLVAPKLFLQLIPSCKTPRKWDSSSMAVSWDILLFWFFWNLFCYNQSLKLIKPGSFYTALKPQANRLGVFPAVLHLSP